MSESVDKMLEDIGIGVGDQSARFLAFSWVDNETTLAELFRRFSDGFAPLVVVSREAVSTLERAEA